MTAPPLIRWFRFVPWHHAAAREAQGYVLSDLMTDCHHGQWACIMEYHGEGEAP